MDDQTPKSAGNKNPMMMWGVIVVVIIIIAAGLLYYFSKKSTSSITSYQQTQPTQSQASPTSSPSAMMVENNLVMTKNNTQKGDYLVDSKGMTLYIFDKDTKNTSNCSGQCLVNWPIYEAPSASPANLPENFGVIKATNGKFMYTYKGMPLYYYIQDKAPGDTTGDGVGEVWHLVKP